MLLYAQTTLKTCAAYGESVVLHDLVRRWFSISKVKKKKSRSR